MNKNYVLCGKMLSSMVAKGEQMYRKMFTSANKVQFGSKYHYPCVIGTYLSSTNVS
jgi:hypothetical protein